MDLKYWRYFLSIEEDFIKTLRYVELSKDNVNTYSIEYTRLLVSACAEIEMILKLLCNTTGKSCNNFNISKLKKRLYDGEYFLIHKNTVELANYNIKPLKPWKSWIKENEKGEVVNPDWWRTYNNIKHSRNSKFKEANLQNVVNAIAGLLIVELYYYCKKHGRLNRPGIRPKLFGIEYFSDPLESEGGKSLLYLPL